MFQPVLCTVSLVVISSTVVFFTIHTFQFQLCRTMTDKSATAVVAQD